MGAATFLLVYLGLGVVLPVVTLAQWVGQGLLSNAEWMPVWGPIGATAGFATTGTVVTLVVADPRMVRRSSPGKGAGVLENGTYFTSLTRCTSRFCSP